ncbi:hypothetical protein [Paludibaculum fermentans]|uniref:hypothetical protein n=1 Tax=Paludibaculum fermentans TaxID=1473598 RepID=UPI003EBB9718
MKLIAMHVRAYKTDSMGRSRQLPARQGSGIISRLPFVAGILFGLAGCTALGQTPGLNWNTRLSGDPALTGDQRVSLLVHNNFLSTGAFFRTVGPALGAHIRDRPAEWEGSAEGFGRRLGTQFSIQTSRGLINSGAAALLGRDPRYQRCGCEGGWRRVGHALSGLVLSADRQGERRFDPSNLAASFGGGYVGASLYPSRYTVSVKGYQLGTQLTGQVMAQNLFLEFGPEIRRVFRKVLRR